MRPGYIHNVADAFHLRVPDDVVFLNRDSSIVASSTCANRHAPCTPFQCLERGETLTYTIGQTLTYGRGVTQTDFEGLATAMR